MDPTQIKTHLHQLIDETDDVQLLTELVEQIEETKNGVDWWDTLSEGGSSGFYNQKNNTRMDKSYQMKLYWKKSGNGCKNSLVGECPERFRYT